MIDSTSSDTQTTGTRPTPHVHRSATDAVLAGVCGGIADYLSLDPSLVNLKKDPRFLKLLEERRPAR